MRKIAYIIFLAIWVTSLQGVFAQTNVYDTITVQGKFNPRLSDADKLNFTAQILNPDAEMPEAKYFKQSLPLSVEYKPRAIKPAKFKGPKNLDPLQKGLVIAGFGNYLSPYAEFFYNNTRSRKHNSGLHLKHHSAWGSLAGVVDPDFNENLVDIYTTQFFKGYNGSGRIQYVHNAFNLYAIPDSIVPLIDVTKLRQYHSKIKADAGIERVFDVHKLNFGANLSYQYWFELLGSNEHNADLSGFIYKEVDFTPVIKYHNIGLKANVDFLRQGMKDSLNAQQFLSTLTPYTTAKIREFDFDVGVGINIISDSATRAFVRPVIKAKLQLIENVAHAFAGFKGGVIVQSFDRLNDINPFLNNNRFYVNTLENYNLYGGFVTGIGKNLDFTARVGTANYDNYVFFVSDTNVALGNQFTWVTDNDVSIFSFNSQLGFHIDEKFRAIVSLGFYNYSPTLQQEAWHKPSLDGSITLSYNLRNKIILNGGLYTFSKMKARTFDDQNQLVVEEINGPFDLNLGIEYRFNKSISAFANFNNITAQQYSYWYQFPNHRFNMLAGVKYGL